MEFALVSTLLFPLLLGIIDYGLWFNDSLNARQGVREAARQAVVQTATTCTGASYSNKLVCLAKQQVGAVSGPAYAKVMAPNGWRKGQPLTVCVMIKSNGVTGLTPLPSDRWITSRTDLSIEVDSPVPSGFTATGGLAADSPPGGSWSGWCA